MSIRRLDAERTGVVTATRRSHSLETCGYLDATTRIGPRIRTVTRKSALETFLLLAHLETVPAVRISGLALDRHSVQLWG
jgi:hypothetical protein